MMLFGQWGPIPAEAGAILHPALSTAFWWSALAFVILTFIAVAPLLKRDRLARFWLTGMVFAAVPVCATLPMDRLLTFVGLGAFGLLARFWEFVFTQSGGAPQNLWWRIPARALAWFFVVVHAIWAPLFSPCRATSPLGPFWVEHRLYVNAPLGTSIGEKTLVVVNAPSVAHAAYLGFRQLALAKPIPRRIRVLAPAVPSVRILRLDDRTLEITPASGYLDFVLDQVFRSARRPMALNEEVKLTGMTARVSSLTPDGRPAVATFRFDVPLESPSFLWLCFRGQSFVPFYAARHRPRNRDPLRLARPCSSHPACNRTVSPFAPRTDLLAESRLSLRESAFLPSTIGLTYPQPSPQLRCSKGILLTLTPFRTAMRISPI